MKFFTHKKNELEIARFFYNLYNYSPKIKVLIVVKTFDISGWVQLVVIAAL